MSRTSRRKATPDELGTEDELRGPLIDDDAQALGWEIETDRISATRKARRVDGVYRWPAERGDCPVPTRRVVLEFKVGNRRETEDQLWDLRAERRAGTPAETIRLDVPRDVAFARSLLGLATQDAPGRVETVGPQKSSAAPQRGTQRPDQAVSRDDLAAVIGPQAADRVLAAGGVH